MSAQEMAPVYLTGREDGPAVLFEDADILVCEKPAGSLIYSIMRFLFWHSQRSSANSCFSGSL